MMKKVMMLIVAVLTGSVFAGPDVMAMWGADDARAKKVLAALADEGECYVIASATNAASCRATLARLKAAAWSCARTAARCCARSSPRPRARSSSRRR